MFISKEELNNLRVRVSDEECQTAYLKLKIASLEMSKSIINDRLNKVKELPETVDCETCGCMIKKELAVNGESVIRKEISGFRLTFPPVEQPYKEYIHTPYYCKRCMPDGWIKHDKKVKK